MLNMPILKFEKSSNYLKSQLKTQNNNKQLILDIITNIGLLNNNSSEENKYDELLKCANDYLKNISSNITAIEQLDLEITNITTELNGLFEEQKKSTKTKEFYIAAFSNIKHNIILYSKKFQNIETKLENDNKDFNNFININNFKYTFDSVSSNDSETNSNNYKFTGFSVNEETNSSDVLENVSEFTFDNTENTSNEEVTYSQEDIEKHIEENNINNENIENLTNKFKELLLNISEGTPNEDASLKIDEYVKEVKSNLSIPNVDENIDNTNDLEENSNIISDSELTNEDLSNDENSFIPVFFKYTDEDIEFLEQINEEPLQDLDENINIENNVQEINNDESIQDLNEDVNIENNVQEINNDESVQDLNEDVNIENNVQEINNDESVQDLNEDVNIENNVQEINTDESVQDLNEDINIENNVQEINTDESVQDLNEDVNIENNVQEINNDESIQDLNEDVNIENNFQEINNDESVQDLDENKTAPTLTDIETLIANVKSSNAFSQMENDFQSIESTFNEIDELINDNSSNNINDTTLDNDSISENIDNTDILLDILNDEEIEENLLTENNQTDEDIDLSSTTTTTTTIEKITFDDLSLSDDDIDKKISDILQATNDNDNLIISEKNQKIYLPYKLSELTDFIESYPNAYSSLQDVVNQEFILPFDYFQKHPFKSRFSETFNILKNREGKNFFKSMSYSLNLAKKTNLNPAVIAACKSLNELESYLYYMDSNNLKKFKFFNIIYQVNLL